MRKSITDCRKMCETLNYMLLDAGYDIYYEVHTRNGSRSLDKYVRCPVCRGLSYPQCELHSCGKDKYLGYVVGGCTTGVMYTALTCMMDVIPVQKGVWHG